MENDLLRAARKVRHWTQEELAELVGVSARSIIRWEKGEAIPQPFYRNKLCEVFQLLSEELGVKLDMDEPEEKIEPPEQGQRDLPARPEQPSTYFVQDRSNNDEMERLKIQDGLFTRLMGGLLSEQQEQDIRRFTTVLDVGCGTGGWLIELAKAYPTMERLVGVDVSTSMLDYARAQAKLDGVNERIEFQSSDALRMIEYPPETFNLLNQRLGFSYLRIWEWQQLLKEYCRVSKRGATIRITEQGMPQSTGSYARFCTLLTEALHQAGNLPTTEHNSLIDQLPEWLDRAGLKHIQSRRIPVEVKAGTPQHAQFAEDYRRFLRTSEPFIRKWRTITPEAFETLAQDSWSEMERPDFSTTFIIQTVWGMV